MDEPETAGVQQGSSIGSGWGHTMQLLSEQDLFNSCSNVVF